jgi:hypothetical protein
MEALSHLAILASTLLIACGAQRPPRPSAIVPSQATMVPGGQPSADCVRPERVSRPAGGVRGAIAGVVRDRAHLPLGYTTVQAVVDSPPPHLEPLDYSVTTDECGQFAISSLWPGKYRVTAFNGDTPVQLSVTVQAGFTHDLVFDMPPASPKFEEYLSHVRIEN